MEPLGDPRLPTRLRLLALETSPAFAQLVHVGDFFFVRVSVRNGWSVPPSVCPPSHEWILALEREREREKTTPLSKQKVRVDPSDLLSLDNGDNS